MSSEQDRPDIVQSPHPATLLIYQRLRRLAMGEIASWDELSALIDMDASADGNGFVQTAKKMCRRDDGYCFMTVRGLGVKRLTDEEIAKEKMPQHRRGLRSRSREIVADAMVADTSNMSEEAQRELTVHVALAGRLLLESNLKSLEKEKAKAQLNAPPTPPPLIVE